MPLKAAADAEVRALIESLGSDDSARREAAIARLSIIGGRAVGRLAAAYDHTSDRGKRLAILRALESGADERTLPLARKAIAEGGDVAVAAVAVLGELLMRGAGASHASALDSLLALASSVTAERRVHAAAIEALDRAPEDIRRVVAREAHEPSPDEAVWEDAVAGRMPDDPRVLRESAAQAAAKAPLPDLRRLIERVKEREASVGAASRAADWRALRGALHQALALRGSRVALYDLRETLETAAGPLPPSFLAAAQAVGDASCLEPLAAAHARAQDARWRYQIAEAFHAVVKRERLTKKHSAMRRALIKAPDLGLD